MLKFILLLSCLLLSSINAKVLIMGDSKNGYKCDGVIKYPVGLEECTQIEALEDISICYFKNMSMGCKKIFKSQSYEIGSIDKKSLNFERLLSFSNNTKVSFGVKRFGNLTKETGMPVGSLLKPEENISIFFDKNYSIELIISQNDKKILSCTSEKNFIEIEKKTLEYDKKYDWVLILDGVIHKGSFDILDKVTHNAINQEYKELSKEITDEKAKKFIKSILFDQYGLIYNRNKILGES
ncbi:MAG: hypothetical protein RBS11_02005 [Sulfurimonas sp.]|jgi:hypothetical protein|nr:hypothetical protein [Sulfurimonas sp.]